MKSMKTAGSEAALLAYDDKLQEEFGTKAVEKIAADQTRAAEAKARLRQTAKRAVSALVELERNTLVLGHLQPRWLRAKVTELLDAGEIVDTERLAELRRIGPHG